MDGGVPRGPLCSQMPSEQLMSPACQGGSERPCSGNGHCVGDGTREGDGSCQCHLGYQGPLCTDCMDGYFRSPTSETHSICSGTGSARRLGVGTATAEWGGWGQSHFLSLNKPWREA